MMRQHARDIALMPDWRARSRDTAEADFESVFRKHYGGVYRLLFRLLGSADEAEDLAQEAFLRYWRADFAAGRAHNVRAWLYRVAANLASNARRGQGRRQGRELRAEREAAWEAPPGPAEAAERAAERAVVRRALAGLPERQARLLWLRHSGLDYRELAEALGIAPGSVGTLLARAEAAFAAASAAGGGAADRPAGPGTEGVERHV